MQDIGLFWHVTIKTIDDLKNMHNENLMLEMYIMQLVHLKSIESKQDALEKDNQLNDINSNQNLVGKEIIKENINKDLVKKAKNQLKTQIK